MDIKSQIGPVIRVGPNKVLITDVQAIRRIWGVRSLYTRSDWYDALRVDPMRDNLLSQRDDKIHGVTRTKMMAGVNQIPCLPSNPCIQFRAFS